MEQDPPAPSLAETPATGATRGFLFADLRGYSAFVETHGAAKAADLLQGLGLAHRLDFSPEKLSGGEKQRVGLARAMFRGADIVLADEPTASLDRTNRELVINFLMEEARRGATVVVATHDDDLMAAGDDLIRLGETSNDRHLAADGAG